MVNVGDRLFSLKWRVWGIAKAIVPEASSPVLFVQDDFEYDWWGTYSDFELEADHVARIKAENSSLQQVKDAEERKKRMDVHRDELMGLLSRFVSGVNLRETLRSTFQTRYVCPLCGEALLVANGTEISMNAMGVLPHKEDCDWFRACELLKELGL